MKKKKKKKKRLQEKPRATSGRSPPGHGASGPAVSGGRGWGGLRAGVDGVVSGGCPGGSGFLVLGFVGVGVGFGGGLKAPNIGCGVISGMGW